jgi:hypothetical protein
VGGAGHGGAHLRAVAPPGFTEGEHADCGRA